LTSAYVDAVLPHRPLVLPFAAQKEVVMAAGKVHLELLEQYRRLYLKARALSLAQVCVQ
jgi:hypothetical protein